MYQADEAAAATRRIEEQALGRYLRSDRTEPTRFPRRTAMVVLVAFLYGTDMCEQLVFTMTCDLWVDRNIILREMGINPATAETATAYWTSDNDKDVVVTGTRGSLCKALREELGIS